MLTGTETPSRTSSSMFFTRGLETDPNIFAVEGKISQLMQRDDIRQGRRFEKSEAMQGKRLLNYTNKTKNVALWSINV